MRAAGWPRLLGVPEPSADRPVPPVTEVGGRTVGTSDAYYEPLGEGRYRSTVFSQGAWLEDEQHMAPAAGLLIHELERHAPRPELQLSRVTFDILGMIPAGDFEVVVRTVRPGRTIELVQAEMVSGGRPVIRATAWRLATTDTTAIAGTADEAMVPPSQSTEFDFAPAWPGGFISSLEARRAGDHAPGRGRVWLRSTLPLVRGEQVSDTARILGLVDTANGVAVRVSPKDVHFPNTDLTIHLHRTPVGRWLGLDAGVTFGSSGLGLTSAVLHDELGPFGRSAQTLTVRPR
jgi:hypothetical protein